MKIRCEKTRNNLSNYRKKKNFSCLAQCVIFVTVDFATSKPLNITFLFMYRIWNVFILQCSRALASMHAWNNLRSNWWFIILRNINFEGHFLRSFYIIKIINCFYRSTISLFYLSKRGFGGHFRGNLITFLGNFANRNFLTDEEIREALQFCKISLLNLA